MKNQKLFWKYDKINMQYYTNESSPYACDDFTIQATNHGYRLYQKSDLIGMFKYKKNAIKVAELLIFG